jgi:dTDP-glucose pyrophosphorylase/CBS domain-containing protein
MPINLHSICIKPDSSIRQAIACLDRSGRATALVVDEEFRLLDVITDGDVRRAILSGLSLDTPISLLKSRRDKSAYPEPVTAPVGTDPSVLLRMMQERAVRQIPLLDPKGRVVNLVFLSDLLPEEVGPLQAVVMAGGYGTRMLPLTEQVPKPMLPVSDKPLLERIVQQLREAGIKRVNVTTHYKAEVISQHFGDGRDFGVEIEYINEDQPLGTAGAIGFISGTDEDPLLIMNGDIVTRMNFRAMMDFHRDHKADMTVAVRLYETTIPYGVLETDGIEITGIAEKPVVRRFVSGGVYLLNKAMRQYIPKGQPFDMPDLIRTLIEHRHRVVSFPIHEYWVDIGRHADYEQAQKDVEHGGTTS